MRAPTAVCGNAGSLGFYYRYEALIPGRPLSFPLVDDLHAPVPLGGQVEAVPVAELHVAHAFFELGGREREEIYDRVFHVACST